MIPLPSSCLGCPFYNEHNHFTPDTIVPDSKVLFILQNPGADEEAGRKLIKRHWNGGQSYDEYEQVQPQPLIGATGQLFNNKFLPLSGLKRSEVSLANSIRCRPGTMLGLRADSLPILTNKMKLESSNADIVRALKHCRQAHLHIPHSTKLIVTMGRYAMFQMTGVQNEESEYGKRQGVLESWRGYALDYSLTLGQDKFNTLNTSVYNHLYSDVNVFITMHIASLFQDKKYYRAVLQDFIKIGRLLRGEWPKELPQWSNIAPQQWPKYAAFDTEYIPDTNELIRWSLCDTEYNLYCVEAVDTLQRKIPIAPSSTVVIQNALADIAHLANIVDFSQVIVEDMMLADSVLYTGEPHSLNYIASIAGHFNRYKHLAHEEGQQQLYSALDAYEPMQMWRNYYIPEFKKDAADAEKLHLQSSWQVYKKYRLPLIPIINKAQLTGVRVNTERLVEVQYILKEKIAQIRQRAVDLTYDSKFNIGGQKRVKEEIYGVD